MDYQVDTALSCFDSARSAAAGAGKIIVLWMAGLVLVWLTGIEPTFQTILGKSQHLVSFNRESQLAENSIKRQTLEISAADRALMAEKSDLDRARRETADYTTQEKIEQRTNSLREAEENARKRMDQLLLIADNDTSHPRENHELEESRDAHRNAKANLATWQSSIQRIRNSSDFDKREKSAKEAKKLSDEVRTKNLQARAQEIAEETQKLRNGPRPQVDFEIAGFKLKTSPLAAPLIWNCFFLLLLGYVAYARLCAVAFAQTGFRALLESSEIIGRDRITKIGRLPPLAFGPPRDQWDSVSVKAGLPLAESKILFRYIFGSPLELNLLSLAMWLAPVAGLLLQMRVAWIGLEMTHHLGTNPIRALIPLLHISVVLSTIWLVALWCRRHDSDQPASASLTILGVTTGIIWGAAIVGFAFPSFGTMIGARLREAPTLACLILAAIAALALLTTRRSTALTATQSKESSRRIWILRNGVILATLAVTICGSAIARRHLMRRVARERELRRWKPYTFLKPGFYANGQTIHYIAPGGRSASQYLPEPNSLEAWRVTDENGAIPSEDDNVRYAAASWAFEHAALHVMNGVGDIRRRSEEACTLLLRGLTYDLAKTHLPPIGGRLRPPSFRLYDLFAGLAIRFEHDELFERMIARLALSPYSTLFQTRIKRWTNVKSRWYKRWSIRTRNVKWIGSDTVGVF